MSLLKDTIVLVTITGLACIAPAGPIDPPAGPVASTMKPLDQVEPRTPITAQTCPGDADSVFKITQPGSYYLTGEVAGEAGKRGIEIAAANVSIDLRGFTLHGVPGSLDGIGADMGAFGGLVVSNGAIRAWGGRGVYGAYAGRSRFEGLTITENGGLGLSCGDGSTVVNCMLSQNAGGGLYVSFGTVVGCTAIGNTGDGFSGAGATVRDCAASYNTESGFHLQSATLHNCQASSNGIGFELYSGCVLSDSTANYNATDGIKAEYNNTIRNCEALSNGDASWNTGAGIRLTGANNRVEGNSASHNDTGIDADAAGNIIITNSAADNTTNYSFVSGNTYGPIVTGGNGAISSTSPWANFAF